MIEEKNIYHYTSFDKFKRILKYGSLRFKESTKSNDVLDTTLLFDVLNEYKLDFDKIAKKHLLVQVL